MPRLLLTLLALLWPGTTYADPPPGYYDGARNKVGQVLHSALHQIIDGQKALPYTKTGNVDWLDREDIDVWEALVYTDSACPDSAPKCGLVKMLYLDESRHYTMANRG